MKNLIPAAALCVLLVGTVWAVEKAAKTPGSYVDTVYGFSLQLPQFDAMPHGKAQQVAAFYGLASDGFAPQINVMVTQAKFTADEYFKSAAAGYEKAGMKIISKKMAKMGDHDACLFEYAGRMNDRDLHFLSLCVLDTDRFVLTTCSATPTQFEALKGRFVASLESFKYTGEKP